MANYMFNIGMFVSTNSGVTTLVSQIMLLYVYFISMIRYNEDINYVSLMGAVLLFIAIYQVLFKK